MSIDQISSEKDTMTSDSFKENIKSLRSNIFKTKINSLNLPKNRQLNLLVLGLTGAGKSTFLEFIEFGSIKSNNRRPTIAFQYFNIDFGFTKINFIDAPGQRAYWEEWPKYIKNTDAILFLIDSVQIKELSLVKELINKIIIPNLTLETPILFLANKQDLPNALTGESISNLLNLNEMDQINDLYEISAINGNGIFEGFKWLFSEAISNLQIIS